MTTASSFLNKRLTLPHFPRSDEKAQIQRALKKARDDIDGHVQIVLVGGKAGAGKTTLLEDALASSDTHSCWTATTKFDQQSKSSTSTPFAGLRGLLSSLVEAALTLGDNEDAPAATATGACQTQTLQLGLSPSEVKTLAHFLPSGKCLFTSSDDTGTAMVNDEEEEKEEDNVYGTSNCTNGCPTQTAENISKDGLSILTSALRAAFGAIARVRPVILHLEDIHWGDVATLEVLRVVLGSPQLKNLILCATYRTMDDEHDTANVHVDNTGSDDTMSSVTHRHENFQSWKSQMEQLFQSEGPDNKDMQTILVDELDLKSVETLLADATNLEIGEVHDLADALYHFTHGNFFFLAQMLETLQDENILKFDHHKYKWTWNVTDIKRRSSLTDNVVHAVTRRIHKLPQSTVDVLKLAACFGSQFDVRALEIAKSALNIVDCVLACLQAAQEQEFVVHLHSTKYKFSHDILQMTVYGLLFDNDHDNDNVECRRIQWKIGTLLLQNGQHLWQQDESIFFATVDHLSNGYFSLATTTTTTTTSDFSDMREQIAQLNYQAGTKAAALSAFVPAANYLKLAIDTLGDKPFQQYYDLAMKFYPLYAKAEVVAGDPQAGKIAAEEVIENAKTWEEKESSLFLLLSYYLGQSDFHRLLEKCYQLSAMLGEHLPLNRSALMAKYDFTRIANKVKKLSNDQILNLQPISDPRKELVMKVLCQAVLPLHFVEKETLCNVVTCHLLKLTLKYGLSSTSPEAFGVLGSMLIANKGDIKEGNRLGNLAHELLKRQNYKATSAYTYTHIAVQTKWWLEPLPNGLEVLVQGNKVGMRTGELAVAFQCSVAYGVIYFYSGLTLEPLLRDVEKYCNQYQQYNQELFWLFMTPLYQCLLNLTGRSKNPSRMDEGMIIEQRKRMNNPGNVGGTTIFSYWMQIAYYFGDIEKATELAAKLSQEDKGVTAATIFSKTRMFFFALIALANYRKTQKRKDKNTATAVIKNLRKLVKAGAINLVHKLQLLEAEMMGCVSKDTSAVFSKFDDAVVSATRAGFLQDAALANYLAFAYAVRKNERQHMAELYVKKSIELYVEWGAVAVAESITRRHPDIFSMDDTTVSDSVRRNGGRSSNKSRTRFDDSLAKQHQQLSKVAS